MFKKYLPCVSSICSDPSDLSESEEAVFNGWYKYFKTCLRNRPMPSEGWGWLSLKEKKSEFKAVATEKSDSRPWKGEKKGKEHF